MTQLNVKKINGMTLPEVSLSLMVMVIFFSVIAVSTKYIQVNLKASTSLDSQRKSWISNKNKIYLKMETWSKIISQPSYSKNDTLKLTCRYPKTNNQTIWDLPGESDSDLPLGYKYCVIPTSLIESDLDDLIYEKEGAKPGIYFLYAIPDKITPTSLPLRRILCRPITYC